LAELSRDDQSQLECEPSEPSEGTGRSAAYTAYNYAVAAGDQPPHCFVGFGINVERLVVDALLNLEAPVPVWWHEWFRKRKPALS
jgi:hypothetical protein